MTNSLSNFKTQTSNQITTNQHFNDLYQNFQLPKQRFKSVLSAFKPIQNAVSEK